MPVHPTIQRLIEDMSRPGAPDPRSPTEIVDECFAAILVTLTQIDKIERERHELVSKMLADLIGAIDRLRNA